MWRREADGTRVLSGIHIPRLEVPQSVGQITPAPEFIVRPFSGFQGARTDIVLF